MSDQRQDAVASPAESRKTFIEDVLAGLAQVEDMDDYIQEWHDAPEGSPGSDLDLHEYLGLSWDEYRNWGSHPESIRFVLAARRAGVTVDQVLAQTRTLGVAARSNDSSVAERVLDWLVERGRISADNKNM
ncbi:hypothetical protein [Micromonospora fluostatini]|uniref:hypothetical protein n=1 Tax=Micromonospora sp. JCM 30529 TaxID=3421643 RepID=UPI003D17F7EF